MLAEAKSRITEITPADAVARHEAGDDDAVYLDVREPGEWNLFRIPGAVLVPLGALGSVEEKVPRDKRVVVYCARGNRSAIAADAMQQMGYSNVVSLAEGIGGWAQAGGAIDDS